MKRYIPIIVAIVVVAAVAVGILLFIKNKGASSSNTSPANQPGGTLPSAGTEGTNSGGANGAGSGSSQSQSLSLPEGTSTISQSNPSLFGMLSDSPLIDYSVTAQNSVVAIDPSGRIFTVTNGHTSIVNTSTMDGIFFASVSADGKKAIASNGDASDPRTELYDAASNSWVPLPHGMTSPAWAPSGYQIAYLSSSATPGKLTLQVIDATSAATLKKGAVTLLVLSANDLLLQWPTRDYIVLSDRPASENDGSIWTFNIPSGSLSSVAYDLAGTEGTWSNSATTPYGLVFYSSGTGGQTSAFVQLQALYGPSATKQLRLLTLPTKCAFNNERMPIAASSTTPPISAPTTTTASASGTVKKASPAKALPQVATSTPYLALYCGVPRDRNSLIEANLPDDYNMNALYTSDDISKVNTETGQLSTIWSDATQSMDVSDVKIANGALFFVNRYDHRLYGLTNVTSQ